jgi:hypothetical protein
MTGDDDGIEFRTPVPFLTEEHPEGFTQHWMTLVPAPGVRYRVVEERWTNDYTERWIYRIEYR